MRRWISFLFLLVLAACASDGRGSRPATIAKPEIDAGLTHSLFFGSNRETPATVEVQVRNRATTAITVRRIEVSSPGMGEYSLVTTTREFHDTIQPGETKAMTVFAMAVTTTSRPTEPLTIRAIVEFEGSGARWREIIVAR